MPVRSSSAVFSELQQLSMGREQLYSTLSQRRKHEVNVNVYRSPPIANETPGLHQEASQAARAGAEIEASVRCWLTNPRRSTSMQKSLTTSRMQSPCWINHYRLVSMTLFTAAGGVQLGCRKKRARPKANWRHRAAAVPNLRLLMVAHIDGQLFQDASFDQNVQSIITSHRRFEGCHDGSPGQLCL